MQTTQQERRLDDRPRGIESLLALLVVCVLGPVVVLAVAYGLWNLRLQEDALDQRLQDTARALSLAVDREVQSVVSLLDGLASSPYLDVRNFRAFHEQASELTSRYGGWVVLTDPSLQQVVNTSTRFGEPLPTSSSPDTVKAVIATKKPIVTDLIFGKVTQRWIVAVMIPVIRDGQVLYALDMAFFADRFSQLLMDQKLPQGWIAALIGRDDKLVARSSGQDRLVGMTVPAWVIDGSKDASEGLLQGRSLDGVDVQLGFRRSERTDWRVAVAAPSNLRTETMLRLAGGISAGLLLSLALALIAAALVGRRISRPLKALAQSADAMVRGERVSFRTSRISEVAEVQAALSEATVALQERVETRVRLTQEQQAREAAERAHQEIQAREAALRASEERYRGLTEAIASVVWTTPADGRVVDAPQWRALTGQSVEECKGLGWLDAVHPDDQAMARRSWLEAVDQGGIYGCECRIRGTNGQYRWFNERGVPVRNADGSIREWVGVCMDIDERKSAEARQALLMGELDHRVRNILASTQSMITLTARNASTKDDLETKLLGRVSAMSRAHSLLTRGKWQGAHLSDLLHDELRPYLGDDGPLSLIGKQDCLLKPREVLNLALVIHELATNAAKYGSLSVHGGMVEIDWVVREHDHRLQLALDWRERGGPPVVEPSREGFGTKLMQSALGQRPGNAVVLDFKPSGLHCHIDVNLDGDQPSPPTWQKQPVQQQGAALQSRSANQPAILVAEDEPLPALDIVSALETLALPIAGPAPTLGEAMHLAADRLLAAAVLDVNLGGEMVFPVIDLLVERGVPVILVTGYDRKSMIPEQYRQLQLLQKPVNRRLLIERLNRIVAGSGTSTPMQAAASTGEQPGGKPQEAGGRAQNHQRSEE